MAAERSPVALTAAKFMTLIWLPVVENVHVTCRCESRLLHEVDSGPDASETVADIGFTARSGTPFVDRSSSTVAVPLVVDPSTFTPCTEISDG